MYLLDPCPSHVTVLQAGLVPTLESVSIKFQVLLFQMISQIQCSPFNKAVLGPYEWTVF